MQPEVDAEAGVRSDGRAQAAGHTGGPETEVSEVLGT